MIYRFCRWVAYFLFASFLVAASASRVWAISGDDGNIQKTKEKMSKLELSLNIEAIPNTELRSIVRGASQDIRRTLSALTDDRFLKNDVERIIGWNSESSLCLPPQNTGLETFKMTAGQKRWSFRVKRADDWKMASENSISVLITFTDAGGLAPDLKELQTYKYDGLRWRLKSQERSGCE